MNEHKAKNPEHFVSTGTTTDVGGNATEPLQMLFEDTERDAAGIPAFLFQEHAHREKPSPEKKTLEVSMWWRNRALKIRHYPAPSMVTIGSNLENDFAVALDNLPSDAFALLNVDASTQHVAWTDGMVAEIQSEDDSFQTTDALRQAQKLETKPVLGGSQFSYVLHVYDKVAIQIDDITFFVRYVSPARRLKPGFLQGLDFNYARSAILTLLFFLYAVAAILITPLAPSGLSQDLFENPKRFSKILLKEEKEPEKKKPFELEASKTAKADAVSKDKLKFKDVKATTKGAPRVDPNKREKDRKIALNSGLFAALSGDGGGAVPSVFGPGGLGTGINNALVGLRGAAMGDAGGAGGMGTRGTGPGGGGSSLGIGGLGDGSSRLSMGMVDLGGRGKSRYIVVPGRTITKGCLTKHQVESVLRRVHNQARYCYEKELTRNPNLSGKITTFFVIGSAGLVERTAITVNTMGDKAVEECLLRVIARLRFPPCTGGGVAEVTYPWIFKAGGE